MRAGFESDAARLSDARAHPSVHRAEAATRIRTRDRSLRAAIVARSARPNRRGARWLHRFPSSVHGPDRSREEPARRGARLPSGPRRMRPTPRRTRPRPRPHSRPRRTGEIGRDRRRRADSDPLVLAARLTRAHRLADRPRHWLPRSPGGLVWWQPEPSAASGPRGDERFGPRLAQRDRPLHLLDASPPSSRLGRGNAPFAAWR